MLCLALCFLYLPITQAQVKPTDAAPDSVAVKGKGNKLKAFSNNPTNPDSLSLAKDSLRAVAALGDTVAPPPTDSISFTLSKDSLDSPVNYGAKDSMIYDIAARKAYLFNGAVVDYDDLKLTAGYVETDFSAKTALAKELADSLGQLQGKPVFTDDNNSFTSKELRYNFETKKGKVYEAVSQQGDGFLFAKSTKFIGKEAGNKKDDLIYAEGTLYTTCNEAHPHFGIRSSRVKVIPNKLIAVGPSYLSIADVPTPLALPFGFFPITKGKRSGLLFPRDFENSPAQGYGLRNLGYYFAISDNIDARLTGDIYTRGSWGLSAQSNYRLRYKFNGSVRLSFASIRLGQQGTPDFSRSSQFNLSYQHNQEASAHPNQQFGGSINFGTSRFYSLTSNDFDNVFQQTAASNLFYRKAFPRSPFSLSIAATHSQNFQTNQITVKLPTVDLQMQRIFPFKRKQRVGKARWYEEIGLSYSANAQNSITTIDSLLLSDKFGEEIRNNLRNGVRHSAQLSTSVKLLKYINLNPTISYEEKWMSSRTIQTFDPTLIVRADTFYTDETKTEIARIERDSTFGSQTSNREFGFFTVREFNASLSANTQIYGTAKLRIGALRALRHTLSPSVGLSWRPDYSNPNWGYYKAIQVDSRFPDSTTLYSPYQTEIFGVPAAGRNASLNFGINNLFEAKVASRSDTTGTLRKITLLNQLNISGSYNFLADSLKLSPINVRGNMRLFKQIGIQFTATFDPYITTNTNRRINQFYIQETGQLARFTGATLSLASSLDARTIRSLFQNTSDEDVEQDSSSTPYSTLQRLDIGFNLSAQRRYFNQKDSLILINNLQLRGEINLSPKWRASFDFAYDFSEQKIVYPTLSLSRDLHCWEMGVDWQIERRSYNFFIRVKPGSLDFIKIPARRNQFDPF